MWKAIQKLRIDYHTDNKQASERNEQRWKTVRLREQSHRIKSYSWLYEEDRNTKQQQIKHYRIAWLELYDAPLQNWGVVIMFESIFPAWICHVNEIWPNRL